MNLTLQIANSSTINDMLNFMNIQIQNAYTLKTCGFDGIYQLGDSLSDTGNYIRENPKSLLARFPYGQDFPKSKRAVGRASNGLLIIDYIAMSSGMPLLDAYKNPNAQFFRGAGVNFAVSGATALPSQYLAARGIISPTTNTSLSVQIEWLFTFLNDCAEKLKTALFMVGEIGGNDYNYALTQGKPIKEVNSLVPDVVYAIKKAVTTVISYGAARVIVPGNFPIGCIPIFLTKYQTKNSAAYDELHCLKDLNNLAINHNALLQKAIEELRTENPNVVIVYGDYYNAYMSILQRSKSLGFEAASLQKACCGNGGDYNFNPARKCGELGVKVCPNPNAYISWDGVHLTQKAYQSIADWLIDDVFPKLKCTA
ncbi:hypothetical protein ACFE04_005883 [Oxalis oulophora]